MTKRELNIVRSELRSTAYLAAIATLASLVTGVWIGRGIVELIF